MGDFVTGTVRWFNETKGYGFIAGPGDQDYFVHYSALKNAGIRNLAEQQKVKFEVVKTPRGYGAENVQIVKVANGNQL